MWRPLGEKAGLSFVPSPKVRALITPVERSRILMSNPGPLRDAYDLAATVQRFFRRLTRQEAIAALDPRLAIGRAYDASVRINRAIEFVEFLEAQEPAITAGVDSLFGIRGRIRRARRRLISLGAAVLVVALALYFVLAEPDETRQILPAGVPYPMVHGGLVILLLLLVGSLILHLRQFGRQD